MSNRFEFEWDEEKNRKNQIKHGVSFDEAEKVFLDKKKIEIFDRNHSIFEDRWIIVGLSGLRVLVVSFTERRDLIRISSARKADKTEEEAYYGHGKTHVN